MKTIIYIRVSTSQQAAEGISLEAQKQRLLQYCNFNGLDVVSVISDEGLSGSNSNRQGYQELMNLVKTKQVEAVAVYSLSRFARNTIEVLKSIEVMNKKNIQFHSLTEKIDTTSPTGRFFLTTLAALGQLEREQISERTKDALAHKKSKSERVGQIPFGFELDEDGIHLVKNEREQKIINLVLSLRSSGFTYKNIAAELEKRGIKSKVNKIKWGATQIRNIIVKQAA
jgi:DNA invertase Pin-like site-specific DNA recombinase